MDEQNVLSGGIETLETIKNQVLDLDASREQNDTLQAEEKRLERAITEKQREVEEEIAATIKKRRDLVASSFEELTDKTKDKIKKVRNKREKHKDAKVSERIDGETAHLLEENNNIRKEIKTTAKTNRVPKLFTNGFYFSLFLPSKAADWFCILAMMLLCFLAIPCGIYFFLLPEQKIMYLIGIYLLCIVFFFGVYQWINAASKAKYRDILVQIKHFRNQIRANKSKMNAIEKRIRKDKDESAYGLDDYNAQMQELETTLQDNEAKKVEALRIFDQETSQIVISEIRAKYQGELDGLQTEITGVKQQLKDLDTKIAELSLLIANRYEAFLGKENVRVERIDELMEHMRTNQIATVSEALQSKE